MHCARSLVARRAAACGTGIRGMRQVSGDELRIAVVGSGVAGLSAAALLSAQGHDVTVFESAPAVTPVGAGILLQPSGAAVLERLGACDEVRRRGAGIKSLDGRTRGGRSVFDIDYGQLEPALEATGVHRASLVAALQRAAERAGASLVTGAPVTGVEAVRRLQGPTRARLAFPGSVAAPEPFDLVLGCDGMRSTLRTLCFPEAHAPQFAYGAVWSVVDDAGGRLRDGGTLQQRYHGPQVMAGVLPVGTVGDEEGEEAKATLFWSLAPGAEAPWLEGIRAGPGSPASDAVLAQWRGDATALWPEALEAAWSLPQHACDFAFASYCDVHTRRWHRGGDEGYDAAHYWDGSGSAPLQPGNAPVHTFDPVFRWLHPDATTRRRARDMDAASGPGLTPGVGEAADAPPVVLLGDAAHGTSPQLGQGANLALLDALVLSESLALHSGRAAAWEETPFGCLPGGLSAFTGRVWAAEAASCAGGRRPTLGAALRLYEAERADAVWFYQFFSRYLTLFFQSDLQPLGWARDLAFRPLAALPYIDQQMLRTLAGVKRGLFSSQDPGQWLGACTEAAAGRGEACLEADAGRDHLWSVPAGTLS